LVSSVSNEALPEPLTLPDVPAVLPVLPLVLPVPLEEIPLWSSMPLLEPVRPLVLLDEFWLPELPYAPLDVPDVPLVSCELEPCAD
jgi:hypothetical protein